MKWKWIVAVVGMLGCASSVPAEPPTYYQHLTNTEFLGEWFAYWDGRRMFFFDTLEGPVRSNDTIAIKYSATFLDQFISSIDFIMMERGSQPHFRVAPILGVVPYAFPQSYPHVRDHATDRISSHEGQYRTILRFRQDTGISAYQYFEGTPPGDSLVTRIPLNQRRIVFVDGKVDVEGLVSGQATIYATDDIGLIDDIRYVGSDPHSGIFNENETSAILGLVSERNVLIRNTVVNGRADGYEVAPNNWNRHSIVINGSIIALRGSFTFENQNDDWDGYQGPTPDMRGYIYLKGGVAQVIRGGTLRDNHGVGNGTGTGYYKSYHYDHRLKRTGPPGFDPAEFPELMGNYERLDLVASEYKATGLTVGTLVVHPGVRVTLSGRRAITVRDSLIVLGNEEDSIRFEGARQDDGIEISAGAVTVIRNCDFGAKAEIIQDGGEFSAVGCRFAGAVEISGSMNVDSCSFSAPLTIYGRERVSIQRSLFQDGVTVNNAPQSCMIVSNTIVGGSGWGIRLRTSQSAIISNNIIAFNRTGLDVQGEVVLSYNDVFSNSQDDYVGCRAGEGSISEDPLLVNRRNGDFHLTANSPCIDTGDPNSPRDPDGTRADMGAFYYTHRLDAGEKFGIWNLEFRMRAAPNPFNERTKITVEVPAAGKMRLAVYEVNGRLRGILFDGQMEKGNRSFALDASGWPAGVYLVKMEAGTEVNVGKVVKVN